MCTLHHMREAAFKYMIQFALAHRMHHFEKVEDFKSKYPKSTLLQV